MKTILIAEDNDSNYVLMTYILKRTYNIVRAHDGLEAVKMASDEKIDLVLMDLRMPVCDGLEATRLIKAFRPQLPIVMLTANAFESDRENAMAAGCDDFLAKPVNSEKCLKAIAKFI